MAMTDPCYDLTTISHQYFTSLSKQLNVSGARSCSFFTLSSNTIMTMTIATIVLLFILVSGGHGEYTRQNENHPHHLMDEKLQSLVEDERIQHRKDPWLPPIHLISADQYDEGRFFLQYRHYQQQLQQEQQRSLQEGDYEDCPICGELKEITLPDATVEVPTDGGTIIRLTCEELEEYGNIGNISSVLCPLLQPMVQDLCGCEDMETDAPSSVPASAMEPPNPVTTTEPPANSAGTVTSTITSFMWWMAVVASILWTGPPIVP